MKAFSFKYFHEVVFYIDFVIILNGQLKLLPLIINTIIMLLIGNY